MPGSGNENRPTKKKGSCPLCEPNVSKYKNLVVENKHCLILTDVQPKSKGHTLLITRKHYVDARGIQNDEWASMLPALKEVLRKTNRVYSPIGYNLQVCCGKLAFQHIFHFHMHVCPKYLMNFGQH